MSVTNCKQCGRHPIRAYEKIYDGALYQGNERIVSREKVLSFDEWMNGLTGEKFYTDEELQQMYKTYLALPKWIQVWDGVSYRHWRYGYFCRYECAVDYANDAVEVSEGFIN
tara:strand:+ start:121 stop:456 length:336 start_codon:yes stop_codon:yes gene_type:complete